MCVVWLFTCCESWLLESEGRPHVVSGVSDLQLELRDPHLHNKNRSDSNQADRLIASLYTLINSITDTEGCGLSYGLVMSSLT